MKRIYAGRVDVARSQRATGSTFLQAVSKTSKVVVFFFLQYKDDLNF